MVVTIAEVDVTSRVNVDCDVITVASPFGLVDVVVTLSTPMEVKTVVTDPIVVRLPVWVLSSACAVPILEMEKLS